jgi:DNA-binding response OmpR family regulator
MRILVCDDDEALISMIRFKITRDNLGEIVKAMDGREAMKLIKDNEFDLIITDINMPFHSGLEITAYVREELKRTTPIIMLSADGPEETVLHALKLGVNDFMTKPFSPADLSVRIKRLVENK